MFPAEKVPALFESKFGHINRMSFIEEFFDDDVKALIDLLNEGRAKVIS
jgi:hypothetical protein